jgi:hypothetical protein
MICVQSVGVRQIDYLTQGLESRQTERDWCMCRIPMINCAQISRAIQSMAVEAKLAICTTTGRSMRNTELMFQVLHDVRYSLAGYVA